ncbi:MULTISPECIES: LacI family DNA-binding transcriptional regulator [Citrobacter]|jgi:LacI family fructose operon transcriptional repressor|uniref:Substrate-binding domain-containing protein n=1 Tax=Citrobacter gillenii TaxID=67828 RepID=A0ABD6M8J4_9ENTR|nr:MULTISPECIES: LacI family DNA-binding transcriptional regulator [Citrobacter]STE15493.1 ybl117 [Escherichia coli]NTZ52614.1 substrate-binding domain-containing protein [Citrobacter gillenii]QMG39870.1 LacI family DNA-binding transcriptional regulator [Citrobacter freundii]QMR44837.1 LacI family DNA-binding transcriptional regulator [Citrobacter freundii]TKU33429.1 substrate-binding domain-containing protein [Citrobacter sp. wls718]
MAKTVEQIASDLNLSVTTVRLVLNGKAEQYRISVKTQTRINEYVERYGYVINHSARSLKLNKTDTLGLIVPNISNVFFATLAEKLEQRCRRSGYQLTISCTYDDVDYENKLTKALIARNVDGLFIVPSTLENQQHHLRQVRKPMVLLDRDFKYTDNALVESHNSLGGEKLTQSLFDAGKSPIWFLVGDTGLPSIGDRLQGYLNALTNNGISHHDWVREGPDNTPDGGYRLMEKLIAEQGCPQAFIASSLPVLEGAIVAIRNRFGVIPPDINIGTFDEHPMLGFLANNVWSMQQDENVWAEKAFDMMMSAIEDQPIKETVKVPMKLIKRVRQK